MSMKRFVNPARAGTLALAAWLAAIGAGHAATTITISTNVAVTQVKRVGIDLAQINYYDSGQMLKELVFRNPGFEGQLWQSVVRVGAGTATSAVEDGPYTSWPSGFWNGATYEVIWGAAKGRTGIVAQSLAPNRANPPNDPNGSPNGTTYNFADSGLAPAPGDYLVLRKREFGDATTGGGATWGWWPNVSGGGAITTEMVDLPPATAGRQCVRLSAASAGQSAVLSANFDTWNGVSFVQLNGQFRLVFKAKGAGGANQLLVSLRRGNGAYLINQTIQLSGTWQSYTNSFTAAENGDALGPVSLQFTPVNQSAALLDDVSLRQTDGDPTNTSQFRDAVVNLLRAYRPATLRYPNWQHLGDALDNALATPFARLRSGYTSYGTAQGDILLGLHDFLELCELVGADPWFPTPMTYSPQEMANLMEYLGGPTNSPYGSVRAARGHPVPWTSVFRQIHIEYGNEAWNPTYRGATMPDTTAYGNRGSELFGAAKASPHYTGAQFNFILGEQWVVPWRVIHTHNASTNHDMMTVAGYMASQIDSFADNEQLFGSVFAEPEWWSKTNGLIYQSFTNLQTSSRPVPLSVYEVNINVPGGAIAGSQTRLNEYCPSLGAGLAVSAHMLMMLRETKIRDQNLFAVPGYEFRTTSNTTAKVWGVVRDLGVTDRKRPQFLACQLANGILAGDLVTTTHSGDDPTWSVTNLNHVSFTNAHHLQSHAFVNGTNRALVVFNLHRTSALDVNFAGSNAPSGTVTLKRLTSANITDNNEAANIVVPMTNTLANFGPAQNVTLPPFSMSIFEWSVAPDVSAPYLLTGPANLVATSGATVNFTVNAGGTAPLAFAWRSNGVPLPGANGPTLTLASVTRAFGGGYSVVVTNAAGSTTSAVAVLRVRNPQRLLAPVPLTGGGMRLVFGDHDGGWLGAANLPNFQVHVCTNLFTTNWVPITNTLALTNGMIFLDDPAAADNSPRFYRVIEQ